MMFISDFAPIFILIFIFAFCIAAAIILSIRSKKSRLGMDEKDFIDVAIENKKRSLNAQIGGLSWRDYIIILIVSPLALGALSYIFISPKPLCIVFAAIGLFVPEFLVRIGANKQKKKFEEKYAMALRSLASSLRSGRSIEQAIDDVGSNVFVDEHIRSGFRQISADIKVGIPIEEAFRSFAKDSGSKDAQDVASALAMQVKVGGSEAKVVSAIAQNINDRIMMRKEIKALFAQTDVLVITMDFLPFVVFGLFYAMSPDFVTPYFESFGMTMVLIAILAFTVIGSFVIRKMIKSAKEG